MSAPLVYTWDGEHMVPLARFHNAANAQFVVGQTYQLEPVKHRSAIGHRHYFACLHEAWLNLPEHLAERFPSEEHLRKWCLIKAGYRDERTFVASSKAEAQRLAAFVRPMDDFAVVTIKDATVTAYTAKSQSTRAMGRAEFQESKDGVLRVLSEMLGVEPTELGNAAHDPERAPPIGEAA